MREARAARGRARAFVQSCFRAVVGSRTEDLYCQLSVVCRQVLSRFARSDSTKARSHESDASTGEQRAKHEVTKSQLLQNLFNSIENRVGFLIRDHIGREKIENVAERTKENSSFQKGLSQPRASFVQVPAFSMG